MNKIYYNIREVSEMTGVKPHVLRYWETEFPMLRPAKDRAGRRLYRSEDIATIRAIKQLLYRENYTIKGARKKLEEMGPHQQFSSAGARVDALKRKVEAVIGKVQERIEMLNRKTSSVLNGLEKQDITG